MAIILNKIEITAFRKLLNIKDLKIGKKITVFSGLNGVGKSNILSLIASGSGQNIKRESGGNFQPKFTEYFKVEESEDLENYKVYLNYTDNDTDFNFTKRIGFKDDTDRDRGIRIIPRTSNYFNSDLTVGKSTALLQEKLNIGGSARVHIPTVFLSLSRLYPLGEGEVSSKNLSSRSNFFSNRAHDKYKEWYNYILPSSIDSEVEHVEKINKTVTKRNSFYMPIENTSARTQSVGQDNLGNIISSLVDFYILSLKDGYNGGILCIDEVDASLHPSAQLKLIDLLNILSDELKLQIFLSSHSLTFLKEIIRLSTIQPDDFELVYFKDTRYPSPTTYKNYRTLKADLFDEQHVISPKVKVYCEDNETSRLLKLLKQTAANLSLLPHDPPFPEYEIVPVFLGANQLMKLPRHDEHFNRVGIVLDGDARSDKKIHISKVIREPKIEKGFQTINHSTKIMFLPGFLPPESYLFKIIHEYINNQKNHLVFWRTVMNNPDTANFTSDRIKRDILDLSPVKNDDLKKEDISNKIFNFCEATNILTDYYKNNDTELQQFISDFAIMLITLQEKLKSQGY